MNSRAKRLLTAVMIPQEANATEELLGEGEVECHLPDMDG